MADPSYVLVHVCVFLSDCLISLHRDCKGLEYSLRKWYEIS